MQKIKKIIVCGLVLWGVNEAGLHGYSVQRMAGIATNKVGSGLVWVSTIGHSSKG